MTPSVPPFVLKTQSHITTWDLDIVCPQFFTQNWLFHKLQSRFQYQILMQILNVLKVTICFLVVYTAVLIIVLLLLV